jgi:hypothetical protein
MVSFLPTAGGWHINRMLPAALKSMCSLFQALVANGRFPRLAVLSRGEERRQLIVFHRPKRKADVGPSRYVCIDFRSGVSDGALSDAYRNWWHG